MLKVKKNTYGAIPKNNERTRLTTDIKQAIQKIEEEKTKTKKNQWLCKFNSINKKRIPEFSIRNRNIKRKVNKTRR